MAEVRREGARTTAQRILDELPSSASVVLHLDVDAFADRELPVAYFPHDDGLAAVESFDLRDAYSGFLHDIKGLSIAARR